MPLKFWGERVLNVTYLIYRFPSRILHNKSPYEILFGKQPDISHLKVFGCLCFVINIDKHRDKLQPRAFPAVFLGYPFGKKGYKVLVLDTQEVIISRNVIFHKTIFPFIQEFSPYNNYSNLPKFVPDTFHSIENDPVNVAFDTPPNSSSNNSVSPLPNTLIPNAYFDIPISDDTASN